MTGGFVIVGGAPATRKTTLARALGTSLGLPVITKDDVKEALAAPSTEEVVAFARGATVAEV